MPALVQTLTYADLMAPPLGTGEVSRVFFPEDDATKLATRVAQYLATGYARAAGVNDNQGLATADQAQTDFDELARSWAYYLAYADVYRNSILTPSRIATPAQTVQQDKDQRDAIKYQLDQHFSNAMRLFEFYKAVPDNALPERHGTQAIQTVIAW